MHIFWYTPILHIPMGMGKYVYSCISMYVCIYVCIYVNTPHSHSHIPIPPYCIYLYICMWLYVFPFPHISPGLSPYGSPGLWPIESGADALEAKPSWTSCRKLWSFAWNKKGEENIWKTFEKQKKTSSVQSWFQAARRTQRAAQCISALFSACGSIK
jgi:hypothetical protein